MASDNFVLSTNVGTGATARSLSDASGNQWMPSVVCYATTISPGANVLQAVTSSFPLPVSAVQSGSWTVAANAGTNLNTSALALESGGHLASLDTKLPSQGQALAAASLPVVLTAAQITALTPISTVTANAGTNLNTSALALESGGHLASLDTKLPSQGQALAAASLPVVLTAAQITTLTPVSTVTANAGSGTFAISGTVTANAGTNLNTSALALDTSVNGVLLAQASTTSGQSGPLVQGACTTSAPSYTTAKTSPLSLDTSGNLRTLAAQGGTWNLGTVTTVTTVSAVTAITNALPAGTNLIGSMAAAAQVANLFNGTTAVTPQYAPITASSSGATTIVSAVSGKKIYVIRWSLSANGNVNVNWQSHTTTSNATGLHYMTQYSTAGGSYCPAGIFATSSGEALDLNLSSAVAVGGELTYAQF